LLPRVFADVLTISGPIRANDIFLAIGCGIANIAAQFALQTPVRSGVELRSDLCVQPLRKNSLLLHGSTKDGGLSLRPPFGDAAIVYLNSFLFIDDVKALVLRALCALSRARIVISTEAFYPRHRPSCKNNFCAPWKLYQVSKGPASWTSKLVGIYIYKSR
ncbi:hypothetical protein JG687_00010413, partial [Phytophthora cactorum]